MRERTQHVWRGTNLTRIGDFNEAVLIDTIRRHPHGMSRVELVEKTGLSPQTISNIARRMIDTGIIVEGERLRGGMGKPRTLLELDPGGAYAVGVHLDPRLMTFVLLDLQARVVSHASRTTPRAAAPDAVLAKVHETIDALVEDAQIDLTRLVGIGFASPGPIDVEKGIVLDPPHLPDWRNVPLREQLSQLTGLPVILDKDVVAAAVGERWAGASVGHGASVFLYLGTGIGTGIAVEDSVVRGISGNAGDIGHMIVDPDGPPCSCGARGCVGVVLSPAGIAGQAIAAGVLPDSTPLHEPGLADAALDDLVALASAGDAEALQVIRAAAVHLARTARTLVNLVDTEILIFGGPTWTKMADFWIDDMKVLVREGLIRGNLGPLTVTGTQLGEDVCAIGAASLILEHSFSPRPSAFVLG